MSHLTEPDLQFMRNVGIELDPDIVAELMLDNNILRGINGALAAQLMEKEMALQARQRRDRRVGYALLAAAALIFIGAAARAWIGGM